MSGIMLGMLIVLVIWGISDYLDKKMLITKADERTVEFIKRKPIVPMHEKDYTKIMLKARVYDQAEEKYVEEIGGLYAEIEQLKNENTRLKNELSSLTPIGNLSVLDSLKIEKKLMMERISELEKQLSDLVESVYEHVNEGTELMELAEKIDEGRF